MADFAIVENGTVVNVIVAEDRATAIAVTGLEVVAITDGVPGIGWTLEVDVWRSPSPFPSWSWDDTLGNWAPPTPYPGSSNEPYYWDEDALKWVKVAA